MNGTIGMRALSALLAVLLVSVGVVPAMACEPGTVCGSEETASISSEITTELIGIEREELLGMALANEEFTQQHEELLNNGFMLGESRTYSTLITSEDGSSVEFIVVANQYESQQGEVQCLGYFKNPETGATIVIQGGIMSCVECAAGIVGGGMVCTLVCIGTAGTIVLTPACAACVLLMSGAAFCPCNDCACQAGFEDNCAAYEEICS